MSKAPRTIKNSSKVASVTRSQAFRAAKNAKASRIKRSVASGTYKSAPSLVKK